MLSVSHPETWPLGQRFHAPGNSSDTTGSIIDNPWDLQATSWGGGDDQFEPYPRSLQRISELPRLIPSTLGPIEPVNPHFLGRRKVNRELWVGSLLSMVLSVVCSLPNNHQPGPPLSDRRAPELRELYLDMQLGFEPCFLIPG